MHLPQDSISSLYSIEIVFGVLLSVKGFHHAYVSWSIIRYAHVIIIVWNNFDTYGWKISYSNIRTVVTIVDKKEMFTTTLVEMDTVGSTAGGAHGLNSLVILAELGYIEAKECNNTLYIINRIRLLIFFYLIKV